MHHIVPRANDQLCLSCSASLFRRFKCLLFTIVIVLFYYYISIHFLLPVIVRTLRRESALEKITVSSESEQVFWTLEEKLRNVHENMDHRFDYVRTQFMSFNKTHNFSNLLDSLNHRHNYLFAKTELLFQLNKFKDEKLKSISKAINDKITELQDGKCHLDRVVVCSLIQDCGYACLFHQLTICFIMSYYMERTMVIVRPEISGMENFDKIFHPVTNSCKFNNYNMETIKKNTFRPLKLKQQEENGKSAYDQFLVDLKRLSQYHSQPVSYFIGHLMRKALRFNEESDFFRGITRAKSNFNITGPYVGIHVRLSDKYHEAVLFDLDRYMYQVDKFYEQYFIKHPEKINSTEKTVYVASDERRTFKTIQERFKNYKFIFNDTYSFLTDSQSTRYSTGGFESLLFDIYFLSRADYLVCTFSSNICRLSYELSIPLADDKSKTVHSLDTPYYVLSDATFYKKAVLDRKTEPKLRRGDVVVRRVIHGMKYDEYNQDGFYLGRTSQSDPLKKYPSYYFKNFYY